MSDMTEELRKFQPIDIAAIEEAGLAMSNEERSSYELYNRAIDNLRIGSEDIAIIELKKAVSINKRFYRAMNLLGLCYYIVKEYSLSEKIFKAVMEAESEGIAAERYLRMMQEAQDESVAKTKPSPPAFGLREKCDKLFAALNGFLHSVRRSKTAMVVISGVLLVGIAVSLAVLVANNIKSTGAVSVPPGYISDREAEELRSRIAELTNEVERLNKNVNQQDSEIHPLILEAERLYMAGNIESAADKLVSLRGAGMNNASKEKYNKLAEEVLVKAGYRVYEEGYGLFLNKKYNESINRFNKVIIYNRPAEILANNYYLLGKAYRETGDYVNAYNTFKKVTELFPDSEYAGFSRDRMSELSAAQP